MSSSTIKELTSQVKQQGYSVLPGWKGQPLEFKLSTREEVGNDKVDDLYQRTISVLKLNHYDECDLTLLIPAIISERPEELAEIDRDGRYVIDGQNKEVIFYSGLSNLSENIQKFARDDKERKRIAKNGKTKYMKYFNSTIVCFDK